LTLLLATVVMAAPLPLSKPKKQFIPHPIPGHYILRWGGLHGEGWLYNDGTMWYMYGTQKFVGTWQYDSDNNIVKWGEKTETSTSINHYTYDFKMDETKLKGITAAGTVLHIQKWDPDRKDFTRGK
jgi:hypothetical protein